jgi:hypothetical protein
MRFLPDLLRFARVAHEHEHDPLVARLVDWARRWPLSSVGTQVTGNLDVNDIVADNCLLTLYVDRIIATADTLRLSDPRVADAARRALGLFPSLAPAIAAALDPPPTQDAAS